MIYKKFKLCNAGLAASRELRIELDRENGKLTLHTPQKKSRSSLNSIGNRGTMIVDNQRVSLAWKQEDETLFLCIGGRNYIFQEIPSFEETDEEESGDTIVRARMPGKILRIGPGEGSLIQKGDELLVMESMKMESKILSNRMGSIQEIFVKEGELVQADQQLLRIHDSEDSNR
jgi:acetyl/propionyl-CoA carboxylase alpha subunit